MTNAEGFTAFVPNGDSPKDTATILLGTALDAGLDDSREVIAAPSEGGFYISDALADALGEDADSSDGSDKQEDKS
jgi:hypothetical protein